MNNEVCAMKCVLRDIIIVLTYFSEKMFFLEMVIARVIRWIFRPLNHTKTIYIRKCLYILLYWKYYKKLVHVYVNIISDCQ